MKATRLAKVLVEVKVGQLVEKKVPKLVKVKVHKLVAW